MYSHMPKFEHPWPNYTFSNTFSTGNKLKYGTCLQMFVNCLNMPKLLREPQLMFCFYPNMLNSEKKHQLCVKMCRSVFSIEDVNLFSLIKSRKRVIWLGGTKLCDDCVQMKESLFGTCSHCCCHWMSIMKIDNWVQVRDNKYIILKVILSTYIAITLLKIFIKELL